MLIYNVPMCDNQILICSTVIGQTEPESHRPIDQNTKDLSKTNKKATDKNKIKNQHTYPTDICILFLTM